MRASLLIIVSYFFLMVACHKEEIPTTENGVFVSLPHVWKKSLHQYGAFSNSYFNVPIIYQNNIAVPTTNGNIKYMTMVDKDNGNTIWKWTDIYYQNTMRIDILDSHQNKNLLTWQSGSTSFCINLDNGTTQWKIKRKSSFQSWMAGLDQNYFSFGESESLYPEYQESIAYKGDIETGNISEYIIPHFTLEHIIGGRIGDVTSIEPYYHNGIQYLAVIWQEIKDNELWNFQSYLGLYNFNTNQWIYEKKVMNIPNLNGVVLSKPIIYKDKLYANIGHELVCHDLLSGNQLWRKEFSQDFSFSGFIIEENKIIGNNEDRYTYCLNPVNGDIIWKTFSSGTNSEMSYLNGVVYFVGGSTGKLHAIDINTGKTVWKIDAAKLGEPNGSSFRTSAVYVFPSEGDQKAKVIAFSYLNAYCFEAYK